MTNGWLRADFLWAGQVGDECQQSGACRRWQRLAAKQPARTATLGVRRTVGRWAFHVFDARLLWLLLQSWHLANAGQTSISLAQHGLSPAIHSMYMHQDQVPDCRWQHCVHSWRG